MQSRRPQFVTRGPFHTMLGEEDTWPHLQRSTLSYTAASFLAVLGNLNLVPRGDELILFVC